MVNDDILKGIWSKYNAQTKEQKSEMVRLIRERLADADNERPLAVHSPIRFWYEEHKQFIAEIDTKHGK